MGAFAEELFGAGLGTMELTLVYLGRRLGLYEALRGTPRTAPSWPRAAGIDARYAREWLEQQAVAGILTVDDPTAAPDDRRFTLPEEHAIVLLDEEHPAYTGALADVVGPIVRTFDQLIEAFRTGEGVAFAAYGLHDMQAGFTRPMFANEPRGRVDPRASPTSTPASRPASRCASPTSAAARAGPASTSPRPTRTSPSTASTSTTRPSPRPASTPPSAAWPTGCASRCRTSPTRASATATTWCIAVEVVHDLADPVDALAAMERISRPDGAVLVIDENAAETFDARRRPDPAAALRLQRAALPARRAHATSTPPPPAP